MTNITAKRIVDADHPWLGLSPFTSATKEYFFGRDREIRDLFLRVRDQPLTILYGKSGLGKTSLLGAGLIPKLQVEGYRPCLIRLGFEPIDPPAVAQTSAALRFFIDKKEMSSFTLSPEFARPDYAGTMLAPAQSYFQPQSTLWELFHHLTNRPEDLKRHPIVLIFDQFEEIFTLANGTERQREVQEFFCQLSDLIENRPPQTVQDQLRQNRRLTRDYDLNTSTMRVVITLREDYLSQLEAWKKLMPSMMRNRVGLQELAGPQALDAVVQPGQREGRQLVSNEVGASIVRFVAKRSPETPLEEIGAVPPLLSLICDELNESRIAANESTITHEQVNRQSSNILETFYTRSFDGLPDAVRRYVEDRMVTIGGYRNPVASEDAISELAAQGVEAPQQAIDQLMFGRLLSSEERGGIQRLEITHDVLAPLVVRSRDARRNRDRLEKAEREREVARKQRKRLQLVAASLIGLVFFLLVGAGVAIRATLLANIREVLANVAKQKADDASRLAEKAKDQANELEQLAIARLGEQTEQAKEASKVLFTYGVDEYNVGKQKSGVDKLMRARALRADHDPVKQSYNPVIVDRLTRGNRSWATFDHQAKVTGVAFSPDGNRIAISSRHGTALWDTQTGATLGMPIAHKSWVAFVAFSPDGSRIATFDSSGPARIWDAQSGAPMGKPMEHHGFARGIAFSPDGSRIATASRDHTHMWDAHTGDRLGEPIELGDRDLCAAFSPDGSRIATASWDNTAHMRNAKTGAPLGEPMKHEGRVACVAFSPDGSRIATASWDKTGRIWDAHTGVPLGDPMKHEGIVDSVTFSPDGSRIATTWEMTARIWDAQTGPALTVSIEHEGTVMCAAFSPDGSRIATTGKQDKIARIWDAQTGAKLGMPMEHESYVGFVEFSPDGSRIATVSGEGESVFMTRMWDAHTGAALGKPMEHESLVRFVEFSPDGNRIMSSYGNKVRIWDLKTGASIVESKTLTIMASLVVFSPDGSQIVTASDNMVRIMDPQKDVQLGKPMVHEEYVDCVAFSADGSRIVTASEGMVRIWDAKTRDPMGEPIKLESPIKFVAFDPDGSRIATASYKTARMWDAQTGAPLGEPMIHESEVIRFAFRRDGSQIQTASMDGKVRIWDAERLLPKDPQIAINHFSASKERSLPRDLEFEDYLRKYKDTQIAINHFFASKEQSLPRDLEFEEYLRKFVARKQFLYRSSTAIQAVAKKNWFTAKFHLPWLCEQEPNNPRWKKLLDEVNSASSISDE